MSTSKSAVWPAPRVSSDRDDSAGRVQPPQVARIACDDAVSALLGQDHNRGVDDVGGIGGAAEFSAGAGELFTERDNLDFVDPQEPRQCDLNTEIPASSSQLRCWPGESAESNTITSAPSDFAIAASSSALPLPRKRAGDGDRSLTRAALATERPRFSTSSVSSASSSFPSPSGMSGVWIPTRNARCALGRVGKSTAI